ncbi:MAG: TolC family protein [Pseudomonadales bacterium]
MRTAIALATVATINMAWGADTPLRETERKGDHHHIDVGADADLTLVTVLQAAVERYPLIVELDARAKEAGAWNKRGRSWIAGSPALSLHYQTDEYSDDNGLEEFESSIELPLWRWGERSATKKLGKAFASEASFAQDALRWEVAGKLRGVLWEMALTDNDARLAKQSLEIARRLSSTVERRYQLGDVARADLLLAQSTVLEKETALLEAEAAQVDAQRTYRSLTGIIRYPEEFEESLSSKEVLDEQHPLLAFAEAELGRARAARRYTARAAKDNPSLLAGPRRERSANDVVVENSIGVTLRIPFGGGAHRGTEIAAADRAVATATAQRDRQRRELQIQLHEAEHGLHVAESALKLATARAEIAQLHLVMGDTAFQKGELNLLDLLKLQDNAASATRKASSLAIEVKRNIALYNQASGERPGDGLGS